MMLGQTLAVLGLQSVYLGGIVQVLYDYSPPTTARWLRLFEYNRAMAVSAGLLTAGIALGIPLCVQYVRMGLRLPYGISVLPNHLAATGLLLVIFGFLTFCNTLVLHAVKSRMKPRLFQSEENAAVCKIAS
jgi:hypothetical protein